MKKAGATNLAQDEASCVVFGMPAEAIRLGGVDRLRERVGVAGAPSRDMREWARRVPGDAIQHRLRHHRLA